MATVRRHRVLFFFLLAYALSWAAVPFGSFFAPGALVAALVVISVTEGVPGLAALGRRLLRWRVNAVWYVLAVAVPLLVHAAAVAANLGLGATRPSLDQFSPWSGVVLAVGLNVVLGGPLSEEPSFRGFAQVDLQNTRTPLVATALLAVAITGWHLPLFFLPSFGLSPVEALATVAVTFWYGWLFNRAAASVLIVLIAHAVEGSVDAGAWWSSGAAQSRQAALYTAAWCLVAVVLLLADRHFWMRPRRLEAVAAPGDAGQEPRAARATG